jgi:hypothetical protein
MKTVNEYVVGIEELDLDQMEIGRLMGYREDDIPSMVEETIKEVISASKRKYAIRGGFVWYDDVSIQEEGILINEVEFNCKKIIAHALRESSSAAVMVCTAGQEISNWINELFGQDEPVKAYATDIAASIVAELAADIIHGKVKDHAKRSGLRISNRYSPGYCGWDVSDQNKLFSLLPADFCGIHVNEASLMVPVKSISAIIGIGTDISKTGYICNQCDRDDCLMAKNL